MRLLPQVRRSESSHHSDARNTRRSNGKFAQKLAWIFLGAVVSFSASLLREYIHRREIPKPNLTSICREAINQISAHRNAEPLEWASQFPYTGTITNDGDKDAENAEVLVTADPGVQLRQFSFEMSPPGGEELAHILDEPIPNKPDRRLIKIGRLAVGETLIVHYIGRSDTYFPSSHLNMKCSICESKVLASSKPISELAIDSPLFRKVNNIDSRSREKVDTNVTGRKRMAQQTSPSFIRSRSEHFGQRLPYSVVAVARPTRSSRGQTVNAEAAYQELASRASENQSSFYVYQDYDSGLNHGFPSGWFGDPSMQNNLANYFSLDTGCVDDPTQANGCAVDPTKLELARGTVLRITFVPLVSPLFVGVNIEEPENWGVLQFGNGYDLTGATMLVFDARSPDSAQVQFGMGKCVAPFQTLSPVWQTITIPLGSLDCSQFGPFDITNVHVSFGVAANSPYALNGGTVLLDNIRYEPVPSNRSSALGFPLRNQTFGAVPVADLLSGRVPVPPDQVLRNLTTTYESAPMEMSLLRHGQTRDLQAAALIPDTFDHALSHHSHGDPLPTGANFSTGLQNSYEGGDIALYNDQNAPKLGKAGDIRLAGFSIQSGACGASHFCVVLDAATGADNAVAIMALLDAYARFQDMRYLNDARQIGNWIVSNLTDTSGTGFGGYYVGYPDEGAAKNLETGKSTENNADIFAAFSRLANITVQLGLTSESNSWQTEANVAGDFVMSMYDAANGRFNTGTVPVGTTAGNGICPTGATQGNDVINTCDFLDADTFTTLALAWAPRYQNQIDWHAPIEYGWQHFFQSVTAAGQTYQGFNIVSQPTAGPNGVPWEFTGQMCEAMQFVDSLYSDFRFQNQITQCLSWVAQAQSSAPFGDGQGLVAITMQNGDTLAPYERRVSTPYQCITERVGLAATNWTILANESVNAFMPPSTIVPGALTAIAVGADGATWGLNADNQIFAFDTQSNTWTNIPGELVQIYVGSASAVWEINSDGQIYHRDPDSQEWDFVPGALVQMSIGADGDAWGMNANGQIYHFNNQAQTRMQVPGSLKEIAAGFDGAMWGTNGADQIYRFNPGTASFEQVPGALTHIAVGADGEAWGINSAEEIYHFNNERQLWEQVPGTPAITRPRMEVLNNGGTHLSVSSLVPDAELPRDPEGDSSLPLHLTVLNNGGTHLRVQTQPR